MINSFLRELVVSLKDLFLETLSMAASDESIPVIIPPPVVFLTKPPASPTRKTSSLPLLYLGILLLKTGIGPACQSITAPLNFLKKSLKCFLGVEEEPIPIREMVFDSGTDQP